MKNICFLFFVTFNLLVAKVEVSKNISTNSTSFIFNSDENLKFKLVKMKGEFVLFFNKSFDVNFEDLSDASITLSKKNHQQFAISFKTKKETNAHLEQTDDNSLKIIFSNEKTDPLIFANLKEVQHLMSEKLISATKQKKTGFNLNFNAEIRNDLCAFRRGEYIYIIIESDKKVDFQTPPEKYIKDSKYINSNGIQIILLKTNLFFTAQKKPSGWTIEFTEKPTKNNFDEDWKFNIKQILSDNQKEIFLRLRESAFFFKIEDPIIHDTIVILPLYEKFAIKKTFNSDYFSFLETEQGVVVTLKDDDIITKFEDTTFILEHNNHFKLLDEFSDSKTIYSEIDNILKSKNKLSVPMLSGEISKNIPSKVKNRKKFDIPLSSLKTNLIDQNYSNDFAFKKILESNYNETNRNILKNLHLLQRSYFIESYNGFYYTLHNQYANSSHKLLLYLGISAFILEKFDESAYFLKKSGYSNEPLVKTILKFINSVNSENKINNISEDDIINIKSLNHGISKKIFFIFMDEKYHVKLAIVEKIIEFLQKLELNSYESNELQYHIARNYFNKKMYKECIDALNNIITADLRISLESKFLKIHASYLNNEISLKNAIWILNKLLNYNHVNDQKIKDLLISLYSKNNELYKALKLMKNKDESVIQDFCKKNFEKLMKIPTHKLIDLYSTFKSNLSIQQKIAIISSLISKMEYDLAYEIFQETAIETQNFNYIQDMINMFACILDPNELINFLTDNQENLKLTKENLADLEIEIFFANNNYEECIRLLEQRANSNDNKAIMKQLAKCYFLNNEIDRAEKIYLKISEMQNLDYDDIQEIILTMCANKHQKDALKIYKDFKKKNEIDIDKDNNLRYILYISKNFN